MLALSLLLSPDAYAMSIEDVAAPCGNWISATLPEPDATDVPLDIAPAYLVESCGGMDHEALVRITDEDGVVVFSEPLLLVAPSALYGGQAVDLPQLDLDANTLYTIEIEAQGYIDGWSFTTGDRLASAPLEAPVLTLEEASGWATGDGIQSNIWGSVTPDDAFVRLTSSDLATPVAFSFGSVSFDLIHAEREVCFTPEVRGEDGSWLPGSTVCIVSEEVAEPTFERGIGPFGWLGCSSSGAAGLFLGPLPLLLLRRRQASASTIG